MNGFRNKQLRHWTEPYAQSLSQEQCKKLTFKATRLIGMLRAHGLIRKVRKENRYLLTKKGQTFANSLLIASGVGIKALTEIAA